MVALPRCSSDEIIGHQSTASCLRGPGPLTTRDWTCSGIHSWPKDLGRSLVLTLGSFWLVSLLCVLIPKSDCLACYLVWQQSGPWPPTAGPQTSSIPWGLVWNADSQPHPGMTEWDLPFHKTLGWFINTFQVEKLCARIPGIGPPCPICPRDRPAIHCESPGQFCSEKSGPNSGNSGDTIRTWTIFCSVVLSPFQPKGKCYFLLKEMYLGKKAQMKRKKGKHPSYHPTYHEQINGSFPTTFLIPPMKVHPW